MKMKQECYITNDTKKIKGKLYLEVIPYITKRWVSQKCEYQDGYSRKIKAADNIQREKQNERSSKIIWSWLPNVLVNT